MCPRSVILSMGSSCAGSPEAKVLVAFLSSFGGFLRDYFYGNEMMRDIARGDGLILFVRIDSCVLYGNVVDGSRMMFGSN